MRLPRTVDELAGLRAARWVRESTSGQYDRYGPDAQREQQDRALERYGLTDTGLAWSVAHSGRTVADTPEFASMLASAGERYDVLLVGYVSRFARNLRSAVNARHDLHLAGAAILFCDERVLSSDEDAWEAWAREAVEAEAYSRRLGKRIREGYAAKFRRLADPGGNPPMGFRREPPASTLAIDPDTIGQVVALFERYAVGTVSLRRLSEETGLRMGRLAEILRNPVYNGWTVRHGERTPAAWRLNPPVSDTLWDRVERLRERRRTGGGRRHEGRVDILGGLVYCTCGERIRRNGSDRHGRTRRSHPFDVPCSDWGNQWTYPARTWELPIAAQLTALRVDDATIAQVVAATQSPNPAPVPIDAGRQDQRRRALALEHAAGKLTDEAYLAAVKALRKPSPVVTVQPLDARKVVADLRDLSRAWRDADAEAKAELVSAIYERIEVRGPEFVSVTLTPDAYAKGLALALPERVRSELVSPEGVKRTLSVRIPIAGSGAWRKVARA